MKRSSLYVFPIMLTLVGCDPTPEHPTGQSRAAVMMNGITGIATFQSIGLTWAPAGGSATVAAHVQFRKSGTTAWRSGLDLWFDARDSSYRGSLVLLDAGTIYEAQLTLASGATATITLPTWPEAFPVSSTVTLPASSSSTLNITQSGTESGYVVYTFGSGGSATIDVANAQPFNVRISGAYVIVRGLTLRGAQQDAIRLEAGAHDVVIEDCDIGGWGRVRDTTTGFGVDGDSAIHTAFRARGMDRVVIQRNSVHAPRYTANSWADGHPAGPQGVNFENCADPIVATCGGNHVIRFNRFEGDATHWFNDGIGGADNFSTTGFPNADTDINGNIVRYAWDDAIESEGGNANVRIWGNYFDETYTGIASAVTSVGPLYIFRNVQDVSHQTVGNNDSVEHGPFGKLGDSGGFGGGRRYYFHNTLLQQPPPSGQQYGQGAGNGPLGGGGERPMVEVVSRNNIWHVYRSSAESIYGNGSSANNDVDYDLHNGAISIGGSGNVIGTNNLIGVPAYAPNNGAVSRGQGLYALAAGSPGFDAAQPLANFNDGFFGAGPDIGAAEAGAGQMLFGPAAAGAPVTPPPDAGTVVPTLLPLLINTGGPAVAPFLADAYFTGGTSVINWAGAIDVSAVINPAPEAVYRSERYGTMSYRFPTLTAGAPYSVRLHFCENYQTAANQRRFDVSINGAVVLAQYDVFAAAGGIHKAIARDFQVVADGAGRLSIAFTSVVDQALINGIEIRVPQGMADAGTGGGGGSSADAGSPLGGGGFSLGGQPSGCGCGAGIDSSSALALCAAITALRRRRA